MEPCRAWRTSSLGMASPFLRGSGSASESLFWATSSSTTKVSTTKMFTAKFWKDLGERAVRTFVQGAGAFITAAGIDLIQADAKTVVYGGLIAGGYAVVTSLIAYFKAPEQESASLLDQPVVTAPGKHDGTQAIYNAANEQYSTPVSDLVDADPVHQEVNNEYTDGPTDEPVQPYQAQGLVSISPPAMKRQRDPKTGRWLPREDGQI